MSETSVQRRGRDSVTRYGLAGLGMLPLAIAASACFGLAGCSPGADYPSLFPAIHDMPPPRGDTPLDPAQVQQATEDLITARNHLSAETQGGKPAVNAPNQGTDKKNQPAAKPQAAATPPAAAGKPGAIVGAQTAGAETKP
jgi:hypothetical protein